MPATVSGNLTTTGSVTLNKPASDTLTQVQISGTYGSVTFVIEGTLDGTNWKGLGAIQNDNRTAVSGTVSPADNATLIYDVRSAGYSGVRARTTAVGSGPAAFLLQSNSYVGLPDLSPPSQANATSIGVAGATTAVAGTFSSTAQTQFGSGTGAFLEEGNINRQISSAGINPGATGADNVLAVYSIPANSFDGTGNRGITITAQGSFAANGNTKRIKVIFNPATAVVGSTVGAGGTTIADTGAVTTNGGGWSLQANVFKYGAANSNTQIGLHQQAQMGGAVAALVAPSLITATENAAILVAVTGNATTAATDIVFNFLEVNAMN